MSGDLGRPERLEIRSRAEATSGETRRIELQLSVPPELRWLEGHFQGNPILPAVVQVQEALLHVSSLWPGIESAVEIRRVKFKKPIRPFDDLTLTLERTGDEPVISFEYSRDGVTCSSGEVHFGPARRSGS